MNEYKLDCAWRYYHQGLYDMAIDVLKEILAEDPNHTLSHGLLAANLLAKGRVHAAEFELKIALNIDPSNSFFYLILARVHLFKNKPVLALKYCDDAIKFDIESAEAFLFKNVIYQQIDKPNEAFLCIERASQLAPESVAVCVAFGDFYLNQGDAHKALEYAKSSLNKDAQYEDANLLMGNVQLTLGSIEEAEYHAKFSILQNPGSTEALRLFANIKMRKSLLLGFWWRFNSKVATLGNLKGSLVLILGYLLFNLLSLIVGDFGYSNTSTAISLAWLAFVLYSWVGIPFYQKVLKKELQNFNFNQSF